MKGPAAVVLMVRNGLVLGLTRGQSIYDLHLPGGKWEEQDRPLGLVSTAQRELYEETGILLPLSAFEPSLSYEAHTGRPVTAFLVLATALGVPDRFAPTSAGQAGWIPPEALLSPWCTFREECAKILRHTGLIP